MTRLALIVLAILLVRLFPVTAAPDTGIQPDSIVTYVSAEDQNNYVCLGSVTDMDGFTRESTVTAEAPVGVNTYTPVDASDPMTSFVVSGAVLPPDTTIEYLRIYYESFSDSVSECIQTEVNGRAAYIYAFTMSAYVEEGATEEEAASAIYADDGHAPNTFYQNISMYISADDTHSIGVNAYHQDSDDSFYLADDEIEAYMLNLAQVIVFPEK